MKKRLLNILLCGILLIGLTGCGSSVNKAIIVDNNGNSVSMSYQELLDAYNENSITFGSKYENASIDLVSYVDRVGANGMKVPTVYLADKWQVPLDQDNSVLTELEKGTKIHVIGKINYYYGNLRIIGGTDSQNGSSHYDYSNIKIEIVK